MKSSSTQNSADSGQISLELDKANIDSRSGCQDNRSWMTIGDVKLRATGNENAKDEFCIKIIDSKVSNESNTKHKYCIYLYLAIPDKKSGQARVSRNTETGYKSNNEEPRLHGHYRKGVPSLKGKMNRNLIQIPVRK